MNPVVQLLQNLGCDLTVIPTNDYECAVLVMKFIAAFGLVWLCCKFLLLLTRTMLGGRW